MLDRGDAEDFTAQLRECSQAESGLQSRLHATGESLTEAEVKAAHLRDRRDEAAAELERVAKDAGQRGRAGDRAARRHRSARRSSASSSGSRAAARRWVP